MAAPSTPLRIDLTLANVDRGAHEVLVVKTARHPSETGERVWLRVLAFAWQWRPGLEFGAGVAAPEDPDLLCQDATGTTSAMVFIGKPEPRRVAKVRSRSPGAEVAVLLESMERLREFEAACEAEGLTARFADVDKAAVERSLLTALARWDERRMQVSITLSGDTFYLAKGGEDLSGPLLRL